MAEELFVDGVGEVVITGMVVRIDFMAIDPTKRDDKGRPSPQLRQRVVMPVDGFVRAVQTLQGTLGKLEEIGVLQKKGGGADVDKVALAAATPEAGDAKT